jgi:7-carboxy-7-deazaguanine synthase
MTSKQNPCNKALPVPDLINVTKSKSLKITEIFYSLQGEAGDVGWPTVFVRLTGCPLRCGYCDTEYAFTGGTTMTLEAILAEVGRYSAQHVCVTGGEPLAQKSCGDLLLRLCDAGYRVSLETSGAMDISGVDERVSRVVDMKTPGSGEHDRNLLDNLDHLSQHDQLKFVITGRGDYEWARGMIRQFGLESCCDILFSPCVPDQSATELADWIIQDQLPVRFQMQLHKILWGDTPGK